MHWQKAFAADISLQSFLANAERGYRGILSQFIKTEGDDVSVTGTVSVGGLGGEPYRDGTYAYYLSEKVVTNDPEGRRSVHTGRN